MTPAILPILAVLAASVAIGMGCSASDPAPTATAAQSPGASQSDMPTVADGSEPPARQGRGVVIHDGFYFALDPLVAHLAPDFLFAEVYSGLVRVGDGPTGDVEPELADQWTVSADGLSYTFRLRDGLAFSDGSLVAASDVKWSWERALQPEYATDYAWAALGGISGASAVYRGATDEIAGVTVLDDSTLRVTLERPMAHFLALLADPVASVLSQRNVESWDTINWVRPATGREFSGLASRNFSQLPVGTGPFRVARYIPTRAVTLEPNPHHWRAVPVLGRLELKILDPGFSSNEPPPLSEYDRRHADLRMVESIRSGNPMTIGGESVGIFEPIVAQAAPRVSYLALNTAVAPFDDVSFRRALLQSADRRNPRYTLIDEIPEDSAIGLLPPGFPGHGQYVSPFVPDRVTAQSHFKESRYSGPQALPTLLYLDAEDGYHLENLEIFGRRWSSWLGIEIARFDKPYQPTEEFYEALGDGSLQFRYVNIKTAYPDPCAILCRIPDLFGPNALSDETELLREMLHDAAATADRAARIAKYQSIEAHILDRALVIPAYWDDGAVYELVRPYISGYKVPAYGGSRYEDVVVDTTHPDYPADR